MKIPLRDGKSLGFNRTMLNFSLKYKSLNPYPFTAIVDTGCPFSFLSKDALIGKRIPYGFKEIEKSPVALGNIPHKILELGNCQLFFRDVNNELKELEHFMYVGVPIVKGVLLNKIPCFIGNDFLRKHNLSIINKEEGSYLAKIDD